MVINDSSGGQGIVQDIDFICSTDSSSYPIADKIRNINRHYYKAVTDILKSTGRNQFDDSNLTTLPYYTFTLVNGQKDYSLPTDLLKINAIEVADSAGNWTRLQEIDEQELWPTITDFEETNGIPKYYNIRGGSVYLYPAPATGSVTLTNGGKFYLEREVDAFTTADTTQEPGFAEPFHRILSLGASYDYLIINSTTEKADRALQQYEQLRKELREFYSDRNKEARSRFRPVNKTVEYI